MNGFRLEYSEASVMRIRSGRPRRHERVCPAPNAVDRSDTEDSGQETASEIEESATPEESATETSITGPTGSNQSVVCSWGHQDDTHGDPGPVHLQVNDGASHLALRYAFRWIQSVRYRLPVMMRQRSHLDRRRPPCTLLPTTR